MAQRTTPEFREMMGIRAGLSDGFTYDYGRFNAYKCRRRRKNKINRCRRADKKVVRNRELKRLKRDGDL